MIHLSQFSGGATSWKVTKDLVSRYGKDNVIALFADTLIEDEDLYRFNGESIADLGIELTVIADGRTPWEVFKDVRWIGNSRVAQCSHELKQKMAMDWVKDHYRPEETILYFGIDWTEVHRVKKIVNHWQPYRCEFPLTQPPYLSKQDIFHEMEKDGIRKPRLYDMGFVHNNCGGFCVRAGQGHFINLLKTMPERFKYHEEKEQEMREYLGRDDISILTRTRNGVEETFTLRQLREEWEGGLGMQIDMDDIGGCGCFTDYATA